jgi:DNA-binding transcriptional LysR family regulator
VETKKLTAFVAVAEELHFGRAARRLHLSQPPLSLAIRALENELGVLLFRRSSRRVELTEAGSVLLAEARAVLHRLEEARRLTLATQRGERGSLAVGFITPVVYGPLPALLKRYRARHPGVRLVLREWTGDVQLEALVRGELDAGFVAAPVADPELARLTVLSEPLLAALPRAHRAARGGGPVRLARLGEQPFVAFPRAVAPGLFDQIIGFCRGAGFSPRIEQEAVQHQTIVGLVSAGLGVAIVPASIAHLRRPGVVYRRFRERSPLVESLLVWRKDDASPALANFVKLAVGD